LGKKVLVVKPSIDTRYTDRPMLASHDKKFAKAVFVDMNKPKDLIDIAKDNFEHVILDELNFFHKEKTVAVVKKILKMGISVTGSGLAYDYKRREFGPTKKLFQIADFPVLMYAVCQKCGAPADHTERVAGTTARVAVAGLDMYIAVCRKCHVIYKG